MATQDLAFISATEMIARFKNKSLSPVETTRAALDRIERFNPPLIA